MTLVDQTVVVACGTYDGSVLAFELPASTDLSHRPVLIKPSLIDTAGHTGIVRSVAVQGDIIVSGGPDEMIQIYSRSKKSRLGGLDVHESSICQLAFAHHQPGSTRHLFSTTSDGCIAIWRHNDNPTTFKPTSWQCVRLLKRRQGDVLSIALHPSNRLAFTVNSNKMLHLWDLTKGRLGYSTRLKAHQSPDGSQHFAQSVVLSPSTGRFLLLAWSHGFEVADLMMPRSDISESASSSSQVIARVDLPQSTSAGPIIQSELYDREANKTLLYILLAVGARLLAFCLTVDHDHPSQSAVEAKGEITLPGRRIKALQSVGLDGPGSSSSLLTVACTDFDRSYLRGYLIDFTLHDGRLDEAAFTDATSSSSIKPVFIHDLPSIRVTSMGVDLTSPSDEVSLSE